MMSLLDHARNDFSQNGEDGIVERIFEIAGTETRACCEFGAWDGVHLSNARALLLAGWSGVLIEADVRKFTELERLYSDRDDVRCVNAVVGLTASLRELLAGSPRLDFLSIDVDGLDYQLLGELPDAAPRVICVEVNAGHDPRTTELVPDAVAARNVGQPLGAFVARAATLGYRLVTYTGNAFFVHDDVGRTSQLPGLDAEDAYDCFLRHLDVAAREWLYRVNRGCVDPHHRFGNRKLGARGLGIGPIRAAKLRRLP